MEQTFVANRRQFLKGSVAASLVISFNLPMPKCVASASASEFAPNAFLRIAPDNTITVISKHIEFGQGPYTRIATILADELDADWSQIRVESAPADHEKYANLSFGPVQGTGGSSAMANSWEQLRNAGAEARARLVAAAAKKWNVDAERLARDARSRSLPVAWSRRSIARSQHMPQAPLPL
jgi:isoquinoline 1-oxidoreductase beta subunit